jgi:tetratricopeptide (TPR) repeat protein
MSFARSPRGYLVGLGLAAVVAVAALQLWRSRSGGLDLARELDSRREFHQSRQYLESYLETHPGDPDALLLAARTARRQGDFGAASTYLRKLESAGTAGKPIELESRLLRVQQGLLPEIPPLMDEYLRNHQNPETPLVMEAVAIGVLNHYAPVAGKAEKIPPEAVPDLRQGLEAADSWLGLRPKGADHVAGLVWKGRLLALLGDHTLAVTLLRQAVGLAPDSTDAHMHLGFLVLQEDPIEAMAHFAYVKEHDPNDRDARFLVATGYRGLGRLDDSAKVLDEIIAAEPNNISALIERAQVDMDRSRLPEAKRLLDRAYELGPQVPEVNLALSQYWQVEGDIAKFEQFRARFERFEKAPKHHGMGGP